LNVIPLSEVIAFEVREAPDIVRELYGAVGGDLLIRAIGETSGATLYWGASSGEEAESLRRFFGELFKAYASTKATQ
jgi:hypothetical protein